MIDAAASPLVRAIPGTTGFDLGIDLRDDMLGAAAEERGGELEQALVAYVRSGLEVAAVWRQLLATRPGSPAVLDFASGYGRVTRFLGSLAAPGSLTVADVDTDAVAFQRQRFGVAGDVMPTAPGAPPARRFEVVLATSLFTHLPLDLTRQWLGWLTSAVAPGGVLAFTVHDLRMLEPERQPEDGFHFEASSESRVLAPELYGSTWIGAERVAALVAEHLPEARVSFHPRIFGERQDLVLVDTAGLPPPCFARAPFVYVEHAETGGGELRLRGWGLDLGSGEPLAELTLTAGADPLEQEVERLAYPAVGERYGFPVAEHGFALRARLAPQLQSAGGGLLLRARTAAGAEAVVGARTLEGWLLESARLELIGRDDALRFWRGRFAEVEAGHVARGLEIHQLEARLAAMRASRFWRAREAWFRLKRRLGLPAVE